MISLSNFKQAPRDYQQAAIDRALEVPTGKRLMMAAPTGTGKGSLQLGLIIELIKRGDETTIVTPSLEVMRGYLERCGATPEDLACGDAALAAMGERINVYTPVRFRNALKRGDIDVPDVMIVDEAHHATNTTVAGGGLWALCPNTTFIGFTATPFRGTPEETKHLREVWGEPHVILTIPDAVKNGSWALPKWTIIPLLDDDDCPIVRGDINADEVTIKTIDPLADAIKGMDLSIPSCVTVPSVASASALGTALDKRGVPTRTVVGDTPTIDRQQAYDCVKLGGTLLISVRVLGEGVDFPWLRRWIDASPTISPVAFLQKLGRITRPNEVPPEYVGTNRNLERHGYLLQGCLPRDVIKQAQDAFKGASSRGGRVGLLKAVGRAKPIELPLAGGVRGTMWVLWHPAENGGSEYEHCVMLDPTSDRTISGRRQVKLADGTWGRMMKAELPEKTDGFRASKLSGICTDNQYRWWQKDAAKFGLDPSVRPTKGQFFSLPTLKDLNMSMGPGAPEVLQPGTQRHAPPGPAGANTPPAVPDMARVGRSEGGTSGTSGVRPAHQATQLQMFPAKATVKELEQDACEDDRCLLIRGHKRDHFDGDEEYPRVVAHDPSPVTRGYYTVVREDGTRRTYRIETMSEASNFAPGKTVLGLLTGSDNTSAYTNMAFVDSRGVMAWQRFKHKEVEIREDWKAIAGDPTAAGKRYAIHSNNCYICGRLLTTPESVALGLGPICAEQMA